MTNNGSGKLVYGHKVTANGGTTTFARAAITSTVFAALLGIGVFVLL